MVMYFMINQTISLCQKIETVQYNAALAITGAVKGTSQMKVKKNQTKETRLTRTSMQYHKPFIHTKLGQLKMLKRFTAEQMYSNNPI